MAKDGIVLEKYDNVF